MAANVAMAMIYCPLSFQVHIREMYLFEDSFFKMTFHHLHYLDAPARYHTYNGHTYRIIDRVTSLQFKPDSFTMPTSRRPSTPDTLFENKTMYVKPTFKKKQISFSPLPPKHHSIALEEDSVNKEQQGEGDTQQREEEEGITLSATIHVAVRRDASLFKIEKTKDCQEDTPIETNSMDSEIIDEANAMKSANAGLLTPPDSPQTQSQFDREISSESYLDLSLHPHIIHVHKVSFLHNVRGAVH